MANKNPPQKPSFLNVPAVLFESKQQHQAPHQQVSQSLEQSHSLLLQFEVVGTNPCVEEFKTGEAT